MPWIVSLMRFSLLLGGQKALPVVMNAVAFLLARKP
jgi:hypothetical protein